MDRVIWTDAEAYMGIGIKDPENDHEYNTTEFHSGPENKRELSLRYLSSVRPVC